jgi:hypothetical protein
VLRAALAPRDVRGKLTGMNDPTPIVDASTTSPRGQSRDTPRGPDYGGGEIWFDGELVRKDGRFVPSDLQGLNEGL